MTLGGSTVSSTTSTITFTEPNGTYAYTITDVPGWHQTTLPYTGSVMVNGAAVPEPTLAFTQVTYTVTFTESGLPSGTSWSVTLGGSTVSATTSTITFSEPNGTYSYTVGSVSGYTASPSSGPTAVSGSSPSPLTVSFTSTSSSSSGLSPWIYVIIGVVIAAVVVGVLIGLMRHRRPPAAAASPPPLTPPP